MPAPSPQHAYDPALVALGVEIRKARRERGISQEELALRSAVDRSYVSSIERGQQNPGIVSVLRIARAMQMSPAELIVRDEKVTPRPTVLVTELSARERMAKFVREHREARGLSQVELGENAGVHRTYIGSIEHGRANVSIDKLERIAQALSVDIVDLLGFNR